MPFTGELFKTREGASLEDYRGRPGNILVISPHPDDDVLGAGGMMIGASQKGRGVFSIYITDGRGSPRLDPSVSDQEMAQQREAEAKASLKKMRATGGFFLRIKSDEIQVINVQNLIKWLIDIFEYIGPAEVYLPGPYERHRTHQRCTRLTIEALRSLVSLRPFLWGYSLWGSFWGGKRREILDITAMIETKAEAIHAHSSQMTYKDYCQGILGRNRSEAIFWESHEVPKATFVEIFLDMTELIGKKDLTLEDFIRQDVESFIRKNIKSLQ